MLSRVMYKIYDLEGLFQTYFKINLIYIKPTSRIINIHFIFGQAFGLGLRDINVYSFIMDEGVLVKNDIPIKLRGDSFELDSTKLIQNS